MWAGVSFHCSIDSDSRFLEYFWSFGFMHLHVSFKSQNDGLVQFYDPVVLFRIFLRAIFETNTIGTSEDLLVYLIDT